MLRSLPLQSLLSGLVIASLALSSQRVVAAEIDAGGLFRGLDANGDRQISADELPIEQRQLFKRLVRTGDENDDGRLSAEEFAAAVEPLRAEKDLVEKQGSRLPGADALAVLLARMDLRRDGRIEPDEVPSAYRRVFEQLLRQGDGDRNGSLDPRELAQSAPRLGVVALLAADRMGLDVEAEVAKIPAEQRSVLDQDAYARPVDRIADPKQAEEVFNRLDANGDKQLTAEEAPGPSATRFEEMIRRGDENGDERLSRQEFLSISRRLAEFESARPNRSAVERVRRQLLRRFDADGDGELTVREAPPRLAENFDRFDQDADGRLNRSELTQVAETMARRQSFAQPRTEGRPNRAAE